MKALLMLSILIAFLFIFSVNVHAANVTIIASDTSFQNYIDINNYTVDTDPRRRIVSYDFLDDITEKEYLDQYIFISFMWDQDVTGFDYTDLRIMMTNASGDLIYDKHGNTTSRRRLADNNLSSAPNFNYSARSHEVAKQKRKDLFNLKKVSNRIWTVGIRGPTQDNDPRTLTVGRLWTTGKVRFGVVANAVTEGNTETMIEFDFGIKASAEMLRYPFDANIPNNTLMLFGIIWDRGDINGFNLHDLRITQTFTEPGDSLTTKDLKHLWWWSNGGYNDFMLRIPRNGKGTITITMPKNVCERGNNKRQISFQYGN